MGLVVGRGTNVYHVISYSKGLALFIVFFLPIIC